MKTMICRNELFAYIWSYLQFPYSKTELFLAANEEIFTILDNQMVKN